MTLALGRLGWTPAVFWAATPQELLAGLEGWTEVHAPQRTGGPLNDEDLETLEDMKRRFPDEPRRPQSR